MTRPAPGLAPTVLLYVAARFGLVAVVAGLLVVAGVPLLVAILVGLIVALPLSMVLFRGLRGRLDAALAGAVERRSAERAALRERLRGSDEPDPARSDHPDAENAGEREPAGGEHGPGQQEQPRLAEHADERPTVRPAEDGAQRRDGEREGEQPEQHRPGP
jgi:Protein of unknown function (DUF4229)